MPSAVLTRTLEETIPFRTNQRAKGKAILVTGERKGLDQTFGQRMTTARGAKGVSQRAIADYLGLAPATVTNYETDTVIPKFTVMEDIAEFLGTTPEWLAFGRGEQAIEKRNVVQEVVFNARHAFSHRLNWEISPRWLYDQHGLRPDEAILYEATEPNGSGSVAIGDVILIERDAGPSDRSKPGDDEYLYIYDKIVYIGALGRDKIDYLGVGDDPKAVGEKASVTVLGRKVSTFLGGAQA